MRLNFKKLRDKAQLPVYASTQAAGMDLYACIDEAIIIPPNGFKSIPTGLSMELPVGHEAEVRGRSGLAFKNQVFSYNGTIDSDYRGEIMVLVNNRGTVPFTIEPQSRVAQMIIRPFVKSVPCWSVQLSNTDRADKGFGSTGQ